MIENHIQNCNRVSSLRTTTVCMSCGAIIVSSPKRFWDDIYKYLNGAIYTHYHSMVLNEMMRLRECYVKGV